MEGSWLANPPGPPSCGHIGPFLQIDLFLNLLFIQRSTRINMSGTEEAILGRRDSHPSSAGGSSVLCFGQVTGCFIPGKNEVK